MGRGWTGVDELDAVLVHLVDGVADALGPDLVAVHLQGSFASGGADAESDCDVVVVTRGPLDDAALGRLRVLHRDLPRRPGYWNRHLEGSYAPADDLRDLVTLGRPWPYVDHGSDRVVLDPHCNTEVTRWVLHEHGVALHGPGPGSLLAPVPAPMMRAAARRTIAAAVDGWERHRRWDAWSQRYAAVSMPRMLRTLVVGDVVSKPVGVAWAIEVLDHRWAPLMSDALSGRCRPEDRPWDAPVDPALARLTLDFVRHVGRVAERS